MQECDGSFWLYILKHNSDKLNINTPRLYSTLFYKCKKKWRLIVNCYVENYFFVLLTIEIKDGKGKN